MGSSLSQYSSPINIKKCNALKCHQYIRICGKQVNAKYDSITRNFYIDQEDHVILTLNGKEYRLIEYHFHTPSAHTVEGKKYLGEIHFVFAKTNKDVCKYKFDLCCGSSHDNHDENNGYEPEDDDSLLVLANFIVDDICSRTNLADIQPYAPHNFYSYDGRLVTGDQEIPVRWIVDECPMYLPLDSLDGFTKESGEIQPFDNRILLHTGC